MSTKKKSRIHIDGDKLVLIAAIIVVFALFTCLNKNFLFVTNMINILIAASLVGMVAVGHTYLIIAGQTLVSWFTCSVFGSCSSTSRIKGNAVRGSCDRYDRLRSSRRLLQCIHGQQDPSGGIHRNTRNTVHHPWICLLSAEENRYPSAIRHSFFSEKQGS